MTANAIGGVLNYGVYSALILSGGWFLEAPVLAVAVGSIAGLAFNFTASRKFVFKPRAPWTARARGHDTPPALVGGPRAPPVPGGSST